MFFPLSPHVIVFDLYILVICIDFGGIKYPKQDFVDSYCIIEVIFGKLVREAPFISFSFSFLICQIASEDDFLEDEWLKPLPP